MNFPPMMTEGSSRAFKFASSLPQFGWEPVVVAGHSVSGTGVDQFPYQVHYAGIERCGEETDAEQLFRFVHGLPQQRFSFRKRSSGTTRSNGSSGEGGWERRAAVVAGQVLQDDPDIEMIYAQAPPFAPHRLGLELSAKYHLPVMFDCTASFADEKQEISIMQSGHCVTMPSRAMKEFFLRKYRGKLFHDDISIVRSGFDPKIFGVLKPEEPAGALMRWVFHVEKADGKELKNFFSGLSAFVESQQAARGFLSFVFTGLGSEAVGRYLKKYRLEELVDAGPVCSHSEELELCMRADIYCVVLGKGDGYEFFVPERLYDVMGTSASFAGVLPEGLAKQVVHEAGGRTASIEEVETIVELLQETFILWRSGQLSQVPGSVTEDYSMRSVMQEFLREMAARLPLV